MICRQVILGRWAILLPVLVLALAGLATVAHAQIQVDVSFQRTLYIRYEPLLCTVSITNLSGRTLDLTDTDKEKWFSFQIQTADGRPLPPVDSGYKNEPMTIQPGQKLSRKINLTPLYPLGEYGLYRVQASIYSDQLKGYFNSPKLSVEITEGRKLWEQTVGLPVGAGAGNSRTLSILAHRLPKTTMLYIRVEDKESGIMYCTTQLGRYITFSSPDVMLDSANHVHILQNAAPKAYLYSHVDLNGQVIKQQAYQQGETRPELIKNADGTVAVKGGTAYDLNATPVEQTIPKMSDRPVPLPGPGTAPTPEDKRPENLLSH
ncbi:hypothetical protein BH09VER1_BH09VER1_29220 [soil metagenome]